MKLNLIVALLAFFYASTLISAQDKIPVKFGKVEAADFDLTRFKYDSGAPVFIIAEAGHTGFAINKEQQFSLEFKFQKRFKILNKEGFDAASFSIALYHEGADAEKLLDLRAVTYNLVNGKPVETKLGKDDVFTETLSKNWVLKKFTLPAVKEGSLIEVSYNITSNYIFNLQSWSFQGIYPRAWSEYEVEIPEYFRYAEIDQGFQPFAVNSQQKTQQVFTFTSQTSVATEPSGMNALLDAPRKLVSGGDKYNLTPVVNVHRWVLKDAPGLKPENYISSVSNYFNRVEFQLRAVQYPDQPEKQILESWAATSRELLDDENFGAALSKTNNWLDDEMKAVTTGATSANDKARKIFRFLRNNFTATGHGLYLTANPRETFKSRKGNVADINLLLAAMLRHEQISAEPVILSTRDNGYTHELYPILTRFNYVIVRTVIGDSVFLLDASDPHTAFNHLPLVCYNGHSRLVNAANPLPVYLSADSVHENRKTTVFIENDEKGNWVGTIRSDLGYYGSAELRNTFRTEGKEKFFNSLKAAFPFEITMQQPVLENETDDENPMAFSFDFDFKMSKNEPVIYFAPMITEQIKTNPLRSAERKYPVEMPYCRVSEYVANIDIPAGYELDEMPKPEKIVFNGTDGVYEYLIQKNGNTIMLQCRLSLDRADFGPDEYNGLRDFYDKIVRKQNEQIVFRLKK